METLFEDGDEQINGDGAPDLDAHGIGACAVEGFDAQMLFDPFEEQFDLPAAPVKLRDGQCGHDEVVGQEDQRPACFRIAIADAAQRGGIIRLGMVARQEHGLVKAQAGGFVHRAGVAAGEAEVFLCASDEESGTQMQAMPACEVEIAAIHDVERAGLPDDLVEDIDIVDTAGRDNDDGRKVALEREQGVQFDGGFVAAEPGPRKQREAQVNGGGIQRVGGGLEIGEERIPGVKGGGLRDEYLGEVSEDAPVALFVGIGKRAAGGGLAETGVIEFGAEGGEAGFDVAETFPPGELGEGEDEELFVSGEFADAEVAVVTGDTLVEFVFGKEIQELGEDGATFVHRVENRRDAGNHPQESVAELKSKKVGTARTGRCYRNEIALTQILTGQ